MDFGTVGGQRALAALVRIPDELRLLTEAVNRMNETFKNAMSETEKEERE